MPFERIYRYCQFNLGDKEKAQDVCQETFVRAWQSLDTFTIRKGGSFQAYLFKIAHNLIIDLSRKKKEFSLQDYDEPGTESLEELIVRQDNIESVKKAIFELDDKERQIIILRYFEDMTFSEIAKIIKVREGALRVRTHRVLKKLKEIVASQND